MAGGDTVFFAPHLLWAHWSRVHWGRGRELGLEPGDKTLELDQERVCALEPSLIVCFHRGLYWTRVFPALDVEGYRPQLYNRLGTHQMIRDSLNSLCKVMKRTSHSPAHVYWQSRRNMWIRKHWCVSVLNVKTVCFSENLSIRLLELLVYIKDEEFSTEVWYQFLSNPKFFWWLKQRYQS